MNGTKVSDILYTIFIFIQTRELNVVFLNYISLVIHSGGLLLLHHEQL